MKRFLGLVILGAIITVSISARTINAESSLLTSQENLWLKSRNNTIVVYPEKNFPPYSYQNSSGAPQGLSIDYIELIVDKIGAKIEYLPARSRSQILDDVKQDKKGDVVTSLTDTKEREDILYFTDTYINAPAVIVVRKDLDKDQTLTLNDLSGQKVAIGKDYAVEEFVRTNNPRIIVESVVDDESGLQQVVLGEVDAAIMDITSLSYYLSKQVLNSVKVVGSTGFEYKFSFAVPKDKEILQSIIDKGLQQISTNDRQLLIDKWVVLPNEKETSNSFVLYITNNWGVLLTIVIFCIVIIFVTRRKVHYFPKKFGKKSAVISELEEEIVELENTSEALEDELADVKVLQDDIREKLQKIKK